MSRRPPPNSINRSVIKELNDRENFIKLIKSREFNLERQKEIKKIIQEQSQKLLNSQKIKAKKLKAGRGRNLRGELNRNKNLQRRYEVGERRYKETQEPRIFGDAQPIVVGQGQGMSDEDRALMTLKETNRQREFLIQQGNSIETNRLRELEIRNNRDIREEQNALRRLELEARRNGFRDLDPIPELPTTPNIGDQQFINSLLSGVAQDKQREREHTETIMRELLQHNERTGGAMSKDILDELFDQSRKTGLRVPGSIVESIGPSPAPPSVILAPDRQPKTPVEEIASRVNSALSQPAEGSQISVGGLTDLKDALIDLDNDRDRNIQDSVVPRETIDEFLSLGNKKADELADDISDISSITSSEFNRRVDAADEVFSQTAEGIENRLAQDKFNQDNPFILVDQEPTEQEKELEELRNKGIATQRLDNIEENIQDTEQKQIEIGKEEEVVEEGAGVGVLQGAGLPVLGLQLQGLGGNNPRIDEGQLPRVGGAAFEDDVVEQIIGGGGVEDIDELLVDVSDPTDEGELLEEVPISILNTAEIADDRFDEGEFLVHHAEQSDKKGRPRLSAERPSYAIQNTSDRPHKKLEPGQQVDITSYRSDNKLGDSIGYRGNQGVGATNRENTLKLSALDKSLKKGFLKIIKK